MHLTGSARATLTMISKTLRTPDLTTIQEALNIMQTEAKAKVEETANVVEAVRMEVRNNAADIMQSITVGPPRGIFQRCN